MRSADEVEICMECYYFREFCPGGVGDRAIFTNECYKYWPNGESEGYLCVNPKSLWCDKDGIRKDTRACEFAKPHDWLPENITRE